VNRFGFTLKVRDGMLDEYRRHHEAVWPEMLDALRRAGWHNYSLFLRPDGTLFGYVESPAPWRTLRPPWPPSRSTNAGRH
jgi:L-rhamnose mutarotase